MQIVENGSQVRITFAPAESRLLDSDEEAAAFARSTIAAITNFPSDKVSEMAFHFRSVPCGAARLYYGSMSCAEPESYDDSSWWNSMAVVTDGRFLSIRCDEKLPGPPLSGAASPGYYPRFQRGAW